MPLLDKLVCSWHRETRACVTWCLTLQVRRFLFEFCLVHFLETIYWFEHVREKIKSDIEFKLRWLGYGSLFTRMLVWCILSFSLIDIFWCQVQFSFSLKLGLEFRCTILKFVQPWSSNLGYRQQGRCPLLTFTSGLQRCSFFFIFF